jgi:hypothetical protein
MMKTATEAQVLMDLGNQAIAKLVKDQQDAIHKAMYDALAHGTSVHYSNPEVFEGPLVICPNANLMWTMCRQCDCSEVHIRGECSERSTEPWCTCPAECQVIDQEVVDDIDYY